MAIWKRKKKEKKSEDTLQKEEMKETSADDVSSIKTIETSPAEAHPKEEDAVSEKLPEFESLSETEADVSGGVVLYGKKISGVFGKGFWGILSILILPPILVFAFSIIVIIFIGKSQPRPNRH